MDRHLKMFTASINCLCLYIDYSWTPYNIVNYKIQSFRFGFLSCIRCLLPQSPFTFKNNLFTILLETRFVILVLNAVKEVLLSYIIEMNLGNKAAQLFLRWFLEHQSWCYFYQHAFFLVTILHEQLVHTLIFNWTFIIIYFSDYYLLVTYFPHNPEHGVTGTVETAGSCICIPRWCETLNKQSIWTCQLQII